MKSISRRRLHILNVKFSNQVFKYSCPNTKYLSIYSIEADKNFCYTKTICQSFRSNQDFQNVLALT